jgi:hypothetical protein
MDRRHGTDSSPELLAALLLDSHEERVAALPADQTSSALSAILARLARLDELEAQFATALEREKLDSLRELAYGASHEINNPLANISTRAQTLLRDETDPERRRKLATINSQAFRAHEMISDMMLFAKPPDLVREAVDLGELAELVLGEIAEQAAEQGTAIVRRGLEQSCVISADSNHLAVAFRALCRNSLEALEMGGRITVAVDLTAGDEANLVGLSVTDTGPGIPPEVRRHIFDPFYSGREAGRGLGFGLSKCWRIVTLHGGTIDVDPNEGVGARFTIQLPLAAPSRPTASLAHG